LPGRVLLPSRVLLPPGHIRLGAGDEGFEGVGLADSADNTRKRG